MTALTFTSPVFCRDRAAQSAATRHLTRIYAAVAIGFVLGAAFGIFAAWSIG
jgi:hypothetical protein